MSALRIVRADLADARHRAAVLGPTRACAQDPMGDGRDLPGNEARARGGQSLGFTDGRYAPAAGAVLFRRQEL